MIYTHVLHRGGRGVLSPVDQLWSGLYRLHKSHRPRRTWRRKAVIERCCAGTVRCAERSYTNRNCLPSRFWTDCILIVARARHAGGLGDLACGRRPCGTREPGGPRARATERRLASRSRASRAAPPNRGFSRHPCAALRGFAPPPAAGCGWAAAPL